MQSKEESSKGRFSTDALSIVATGSFSFAKSTKLCMGSTPYRLMPFNFLLRASSISPEPQPTSSTLLALPGICFK